MSVAPLRPTSWLAKRLGLSVSTVERLRAQGGDALPPHITIGGHSIRYDEAVVEAWIEERLIAGRRSAEQPTAGRRLKRIGNKIVAVPA